MKKDVIYIDTEDDITAIIDKVKTAKAPVVALVPPKRIGVLQSIVNLKLLKRTADEGKKHIVLITNDAALSALAAGVAVPVAKNLQSKPELPTVIHDDEDDESDVIEGESPPEIPTADESDVKKTVTKAAVGAAAVAPVAKVGTKDRKIPNFDAFRKKLFIIGGLAVLLIAFFVWALFFAGTAKVTITAQTSVVNVSKTLQLVNNATLDPAQNTLPPVIKQVKKTQSVDFKATGQKDVGEIATGTVRLSPTDDTIRKVYYGSSVTIPAGSSVTSTSGLVYTTTQAVTYSDSNRYAQNVGVTAAGRGSKYNGASGNASASPSGTTAAFVGSTAGGTDKTITVVTQEDVNKAAEQLQSQDNNAVRDELKKQFDSQDIVIENGFVVEPGTPTAAPGVDQEATTAKLTAETTYTLVGVKKTDLKAVYDVYLKTQIGNNTAQRVYDSGEATTQFSEFAKTDNGYTAKIAATAQVGPNIDKAKLTDEIKGMRQGEVQQKIEAIKGVESVDVNFSPFWVSRVPNDTKRITVEFTLKNVANGEQQ